MIAALLATVVLAQGGAGAEELWERYPLEPAATPTAEATQRPAEPSATADSGADRAVGVPDDDGPDTVTLVVLVALGALAGAAALSLAQTRRLGRRSGDTPPAEPAPRGEPSPLDRPAPQRPALDEPPAATARRTPARPADADALRGPPEEPSPPAVAEPAGESRRFAPSPIADPRLCRIRLWHGYVTRCFLAQIEGEEAPIARSATFRAVATPEATAALEGLVEELRASGWEPVHDAAGEWRGAMRRRVGVSASHGGPATAG